MQPTLQLKPLGIADLLDTAFRLYRGNFTLFVGIVAVLLVPMALLQLGALAYFGNATPVELIQNIVVINLVSGTLATAIARMYLGQPTSIGAAYRVSRSRFWAVIAASIAQGLIIGAPVLVVVACSFGLLLRSSGLLTSWLVGIALIIALLPGVLLLVRFALAIPAIMLERIDATAGLKRSWQLTQGAFWRTLLVSFVVTILSYLLAQLPSIGLAYAITVSGASIGEQMQAGVVAGLSQLGVILALPIQLAAQTLLYYDLRVRKEGYDLELLAQQAV